MSEKNRNNKEIKSYIFTKETMGITLLLFCGVVFIMLLTRNLVFAGVGTAVCTFMYGVFGYGSYFVLFLLGYLGVYLAFGKKIKIPFLKALTISLTVLMAFLLVHSITSNTITLQSYGDYISGCYLRAAEGWSGYTFGGVISAILVYPVATLTTFIGAYVIYSALTLLCAYLTFLAFKRSAKNRGSKVNAEPKREQETEETETVTYAREPEFQPQIQPLPQSQPVQTELRSVDPPVQNYAANQDYGYNQDYAGEQEREERDLGKKILFENGEFAAESYKRNMIFSEESYFSHPVTNGAEDYLSSFSNGTKKASAPVPEKSYQESYKEDVVADSSTYTPTNYVYGEKPVDEITDNNDGSGISYTELTEKNTEEETPDFSSSYSHNNYSEAAPADYNSDFNISSFENTRPVDTDFNSFVNNDTDRMKRREETFNDNFANDDFNDKIEENAADESLPEIKEEPVREDFPRETENRFTDERRMPERNFIDENRTSDRGITEENRTSERNFIDENRTSDRGFSEERRAAERSDADFFDDDNDEEDIFSMRSPRGDNEPERNVDTGRTELPERRTSLPESGREEEVKLPLRRGTDKPESKPAAPEPAPAPAEKPKHVWKKYVRPPINLLDDYPENNNVNTGEIEENKRIIVETLEKFKIASHISNVVVGPAITRYDVIIEDKTNIKRAMSFRDSIAMSLMKENVNTYLNYAKGAISLEVPNNSRSIVGLKSVIASSKFINGKQNSLTFALGKSVDGEVICPDITRMPHLLVAGTTGSGKSICLSAMLISLLYRYGPDELRLILVDPKQVEFIPYDKLPHLMINEILHDVNTALKALKWANDEMERRYTLFKTMTEAGTVTKNLEEYNSHLPEGEEKLPKILIVLDEFGDLMLQAKKEVERLIIKLVQKARACGIHLILATQRPSVDCITGLIKSNLPTRIGFKVNSFDDSRTIFDIGGAEKLLGKGDLYFRSSESPELMRIQCCFIDTHEVQKVTDFIKENNETYFDQSVADYINTVESSEEDSSGAESSPEEEESKIDETYIKALKFCITSNQASVSMLQRRFPVGYIKACKIIDWMANMNYITQSEGSKPRKVLITMEEFLNTYEDVDD